LYSGEIAGKIKLLGTPAYILLLYGTKKLFSEKLGTLRGLVRIIEKKCQKKCTQAEKWVTGIVAIYTYFPNGVFKKRTGG
jgi:hypothetical protein